MEPLTDDQQNAAATPPRTTSSTHDALEPANDADSAWAMHVVEVNEQLILASLHAEKMFESAAHHLDELTRIAQRDALTDTPNRALMLDRLRQAVATAKRNLSRIAVLFIDLDDFKQINDARGHSAGDEVLKAAARAIESVVRRSDTVSRYGGDEFLVLLPEISHSSAAAQIATKMLAALSTPVRLGADLICLSASIGIAIFPDDGDEASTLIHCADNAMYRSKRRAHGHYAFHRAALEHHDVAVPAADDSSQPASNDSSRHHHRGQMQQHRLDLTETTPQVPGGFHGSAAHDDQGDAQRRESMFQATVADELRSPFTSAQESIALLNQVQTEDPLLRVLIDRETAHLSAPVYESFEARHTNAARFVQSATVKTGSFVTIDSKGLRHTVIEFTVTARCGLHDQTRRSMSERSFGLASGERVTQLSFADFQIASSGLLLHRI